MDAKTNSKFQGLKVALVYDRVNKWGGAEQVLLSLHKLFPNAPLYTSVYSSKSAGWAKVFPDIIPSFMQKLPLAQTSHEFFSWLTPMAFESLNLTGYDIVISVTSADAKGVITHPGTFHLCYCLTPTRYLWSHYEDSLNQINSYLAPFVKPVFAYLRSWDKFAATKPDAYVAISQTVKNRIFQFYGQDSTIVYPGVAIGDFQKHLEPPRTENYFLYVGRLVFHKYPEKVIRAFNKLNHRLVIVGTGRQEKYLRKLAGPHVTFTGFVSRTELISYYQNAKAVVFFHEEDFGLVPVEAQAAGTPVIALGRGGAFETVIHNKTGLIINDSSWESLRDAIAKFDPQNFDSTTIQAHASTFSNERFEKEFVKVFLSEWTKYKNIYLS